MYPSFFSTSASADFCFEAGINTSSFIAAFALRMRVSMSAIGSVIMTQSPTCLGQTRDFTGMGHLAKAQAAQSEFAIHSTRASTFLATRVTAYLELRRFVRLVYE
jgi:hypothetical protein